MNTKIREILQEKYEVISRAADDSTYILLDSENLTEEEIEHKLYARFDRINVEMENIGEILKRYYTPIEINN